MPHMLHEKVLVAGTRDEDGRVESTGDRSWHSFMERILFKRPRVHQHSRHIRTRTRKAQEEVVVGRDSRGGKYVGGAWRVRWGGGLASSPEGAKL